MKKKIAILAAVMAAAALTAGCGGGEVTYKDGTYTAQSETYVSEEEGAEGDSGYGVTTLTIKDGVITECTFETFDIDGNPKDENYGKKEGSVANKDYYNKAQKAVAACEKYAQALVETNDLKQVDQISGATINYEEFQDTVTACLKEAASK